MKKVSSRILNITVIDSDIQYEYDAGYGICG